MFYKLKQVALVHVSINTTQKKTVVLILSTTK